MISLFGSEYTFLSPLALLVLPVLAGLLIFAYLKLGKTVEQIISCSMFLPVSDNRFSRPKRFVPPLRMFIELLALILFCFAIARMIRTEGSSVTTILIDNSLSMAARDNLGQSALDHALKDADAFIASLPSLAKVELFLSSPALNKVVSGTPTEARAALINIHALAARDDLDQALPQLLNDQRLLHLVVFSDRLARYPKQTLQDFRLEYHQINKAENASYNNVAIVALAVSGRSIELSLANYSAQAQSVNLAIEELNIRDNIILANRNLERELRLPSSGQANFSFDVGPLFNRTFHISLQSAGDAITLDNEAWLHSSSQKSPLTFVGPIDPTQLGLRSIPNLAINYLKPDAYEKEARSQSGPIIFHRMMPATLPDSDSAIIMPPETSEPIRISASREATTLTSWDNTHALLSYLKFAEFHLGTLRPVTVPSWGKTLMSSSDGAALVYGQPKGSKLAVYGFELFPFEGKNNTASSVLTLNLLNWLDVKSNDAGFELAPFPLPGDAKAIDLLKSQNSPTPIVRTNATLTAGLYVVTKKESSEIVACNFFDEKESNVQSTQVISLPEANFSDLKPLSGESVIPSIATLLLCLVIIDYLIASLFSSRKVRSR